MCDAMTGKLALMVRMSVCVRLGASSLHAIQLFVKFQCPWQLIHVFADLSNGMKRRTGLSFIDTFFSGDWIFFKHSVGIVCQ